MAAYASLSDAQLSDDVRRKEELMLAAYKEFEKYIAAAKAGKVVFCEGEDAYTSIRDSKHPDAEMYREYEKKIAALEAALNNPDRNAQGQGGSSVGGVGAIDGSMATYIRMAVSETAAMMPALMAPYLGNMCQGSSRSSFAKIFNQRTTEFYYGEGASVNTCMISGIGADPTRIVCSHVVPASAKSDSLVHLLVYTRGLGDLVDKPQNGLFMLKTLEDRYEDGRLGIWTPDFLYPHVIQVLILSSSLLKEEYFKGHKYQELHQKTINLQDTCVNGRVPSRKALYWRLFDCLKKRHMALGLPLLDDKFAFDDYIGTGFSEEIEHVVQIERNILHCFEVGSAFDSMKTVSERDSSSDSDSSSRGSL